MQKYEIVATTLMGLENVLMQELTNLGAQNIEKLRRAVRFVGDDELLYKANLSARTALRFLVPIEDFSAENEAELYSQAKVFPWEKVLHLNQTFSIDATISGNHFRHSQYVALKVKDAIADRFREKKGKRPDVDRENPDIVINIHVTGSEVVISLDSTGLSLDRRGYRKKSNEAPINEVLAAGIILMSGWRSDIPFYDPMAGSGTFSIEAALIGTKTPPNLNRVFCLQNWRDFDHILYNKVKAALKSEIIEPDLQIFARDILPKNLEIIAENAELAGMDEYINLKKADFFETEPTTENGIVFLNPPYGERMKIEDVFDFYSRIGDTLKQKYAGFEAWMISSDKEAIKKVGLRGEQKIDLLNGGLEARLLKYELYKGKK
ncbi:THUMP domain-containing class I SAM-dependent RNA methyltransferase [Lacihabitans soyangensis]|uniref:THUMP domain-containing class I SAM-dependent RNA methyltransferase n=1 Tax=Lacihabitans soyangensis TaxID=869394 RepID=UPI0020CFE61C|nr:class I SAM-dependent RNA methyltransferase [Lacihabitans soyangensis]